MKTEYASDEKSSKKEIQQELDLFFSGKQILNILDLLPISILILNKNRQILFANEVFKTIVPNDRISNLLSLRTGEAINCEHAFENEGGCGTTKFCSQCGAVNAILKCQSLEKGIEECRIVQTDGNALEFLVWANPIQFGSEYFTLFSVIDISSDKRKKALERIFYHDIMNTAGSLKGIISLLMESNENGIKELVPISSKMVDRLIGEINEQRLLTAAENEDLDLNLTAFSTRELIGEVKLLYGYSDSNANIKIDVDKNSVDAVIISDKTLMRRVLINLLKNAVEASVPGEVVKISCSRENDEIIFQINNRAFMEEKVQLQVFKRSFSTKGATRGLGTYSVKLLSEKYLKGNVKFISDKKHGTTFFVKYPMKIDQYF